MSDWREFVQEEIKRLFPDGLDDSFWDDCLPEDEAPSAEESLQKNWEDTWRDYGVLPPDSGASRDV